MRHLVIDRGNTSIKMAIYADGVTEWYDRVPSLGSSDIQSLIDTNGVSALAYCASGPSDISVTGLRGLSACIQLDASIDLPVEVQYLTPTTLGPDRIACVMGALSHRPGEDLMVISLGTCMTVDFITHGQKWIGGVISPGLKMRYSAMHAYTERLPIVHHRDVSGVYGRSTREALASGGYYGMAMEIEGWIRYADSHLDRPRVLITGGDAEDLARRIKKEIFVHPYLALDGLDYILTLHA